MRVVPYPTLSQAPTPTERRSAFEMSMGGPIWPDIVQPDRLRESPKTDAQPLDLVRQRKTAIISWIEEMIYALILLWTACLVSFPLERRCDHDEPPLLPAVAS